jgi:hypothetical protein
MDGRELRLIELLDQLQQLNPALTGDTDMLIAARISLRAGDGHLVGVDALLSDKALDALNAALAAVLAHAQSQCPDDALSATGTVPDTASVETPELPELNPLALAELNAHFDGIDSGSFLEDAEKAEDREAAGHAFDTLVLGDDVDGAL